MLNDCSKDRAAMGKSLVKIFLSLNKVNRTHMQQPHTHTNTHAHISPTQHTHVHPLFTHTTMCSQNAHGHHMLTPTTHTQIEEVVQYVVRAEVSKTM